MCALTLTFMNTDNYQTLTSQVPTHIDLDIVRHAQETRHQLKYTRHACSSQHILWFRRVQRSRALRNKVLAPCNGTLVLENERHGPLRAAVQLCRAPPPSTRLLGCSQTTCLANVHCCIVICARCKVS